MLMCEINGLKLNEISDKIRKILGATWMRIRVKNSSSYIHPTDEILERNWMRFWRKKNILEESLNNMQGQNPSPQGECLNLLFEFLLLNQNHTKRKK